MEKGCTKKGFTLIELLVVIAIIALLMAVIVPSLKLAKQKAASIVCMANVKNMSLGWFSYKEDNDDRIMSAAMGGTELVKDGPIVFPQWIGAPENASGAVQSATQTTPEVTDEDEIRGIKKGALYPYLEAPKVYNCPADKVKSNYDLGEKFVTYAIADCLAGYQVMSENGDSAQSYYWRITSFNQITSPSDRYIFVETAEERNYTVSGHWVFGAREIPGCTPEVMWGPMAVNHGDSSILGFTDGHAVRRKWQTTAVKDWVTKLSSLGTGMYGTDDSGENASNNEDIAFLAKGWAYHHK